MALPTNPTIAHYIAEPILNNKTKHSFALLLVLIQAGANITTVLFLVKFFTSQMQPGGNPNTALTYLALGVGSAALSVIAKWLTSEILTPTSSELGDSLGEDILEAHYTLPFTSQVRPRPDMTSIVNYIGASVIRIPRAFGDGLKMELLPVIIEMLAASAAIPALAGPMGAIVTVAMTTHLLILGIASPFMGKAYSDYMKAMYKMMDAAIAQLGQFRNVKIFNAVNTQLRKIARVFKEYGSASDYSILIRNRTQLFTSLVHVVALLVTGLMMVYQDAALDEKFLLVFTYLLRTIPNLEGLNRAVSELLGEKEFFKDSARFVKMGKEHADDAPKPELNIKKETASIEFDKVTIQYPGVEEPILKDVSFKIKAGQFVAIIGPSGTGKSTILNAIEGFISPNQGTIKIHDTNLKDVDIDSVRKTIAFVPQETTLFNVSLYNNIVFGNEKATKEQVNTAIRNANLTGVFNQHKNKALGIEGTVLSPGQKARVGIGRVLVRDATILLLDEPTASLDQSIEKEILRELAELARNFNYTTVFITHSPSVVNFLKPDQIIVVDNAKIIEKGTHQELMNKNGYYANQMAIEKQSGREINETSVNGDPIENRESSSRSSQFIMELGEPLLAHDEDFSLESPDDNKSCCLVM